jgi:hypothetical protein
MSHVDVVDSKCDLCTRCRPLLRWIEGKVKVGSISPGDLCVISANPPVVNPVVTGMEI